MRHDDRRSLAHHAAEPRKNLLFRVRIDRRQRVIEDQNWRIDDERARDGRPLFLAARERNASFADHRVVALRKIGDVFVEARDGGCLDDARHSVGRSKLRPYASSGSLGPNDVELSRSRR